MIFDLAIIGAGIHGAAIARAAAAEGYRVIILEQFNDVSQGTSSRSSKLIHGGLRYLESHQFKLVHECLRERNILLKTAPAFVTLRPFYIPVYQNSKRHSLTIASGLLLYRLLGGGKFRKLNKSEWAKLNGLRTDKLKAVYQYYDGQTDDARLTRAVIQHAETLGAELKTATRVTSIQLSQQQLLDTTTGPVAARLIINASGPWVNRVLEHVTPGQTMLNIDLVQGTHIVIPRQLESGVFYVEAADGRVVFAIPWQQQVMVGTTEKDFHGDPANVEPQEDEISYLLDTWNHYFNDQLQTADIITSFAGLRVLPQSTADAFSRSRDTLIHCDEEKHPRIISIYGGKLTSHRATAEQVMHKVHRIMPPPHKVDTRKLPLPGKK